MLLALLFLTAPLGVVVVVVGNMACEVFPSMEIK